MPVIVAESLERVDLPLETILRPPRSSEPAEVVAQIARGLGRPVDLRAAPDWLRREQQQTCSRLLPVLRRYRCALLADPVGSGKTWIALAVASMWTGDYPAVVLAPATLLSQWERTAARAGVAVELWSHQRLSRGTLPPRLLKSNDSSLVIIDESHHFRNPGTRRYRTLAPRLIGSAVLLLSATPVVNRVSDLAAQLTLGARDDALLPFGVPSITEHLAGRRKVSTALGELLLARRGPITGKPARVERKERIPAADLELEARCGRIERLVLSTDHGTAALIRTVIWRALASSDMALLAVLRRYRSLLCHAREAGETGRTPSRKALKGLLGDDDQQLIMWDLLPPLSSVHDLALEDLPMLEILIAEARAASRVRDAKCDRLAGLLQDGKPTLIFAGARETVRYLRGQLSGVAWCTGEAAGIGFTRLKREDVLSWFRPGSCLSGGPGVLVTTDVAAEGLDLQTAARVVHYDLPWTAVRMDQRDGRALRLGSTQERVEVVRLDLPAPIERRLGQLAVLARKRRLPRQAGAEADAARPWSWRDEISERYGAASTATGPGRCCVIPSAEAGLLVGYVLYTLEAGGQRRGLVSVAGYLDSTGVWSEEPGLIDRKMNEARTAVPSDAGSDIPGHGLRMIAAIVRERLESLQLARWSHRLSPLQSRAIVRLNQLAARAVQARNGRLLSTVERAMDFARRGHTAGETIWLDWLLTLPDAALIGEFRQCPEAPPETTTLSSELLGVIVFAPSSSISTGP